MTREERIDALATRIATEINTLRTEIITYDDTAIQAEVDLNTTHTTSDGTDHGFIDQDVTTTAQPAFVGVDFDSTISAPAYQEGRVFYDQTTKSLSVYDDVTNTLLQLGQEERIRVYNPTGSTISNGSAVSVTGVSNGVVEVGLAIASTASSALNTIGIATHDIPTLNYGWAATSGTVNDVDTSGYTDGSLIYLSDTIAGAYTETRPKSPSYEVRMGGIIESNALTGKIYAELRIINNIQNIPEYFDGSTIDLTDFLVSSDGATVTASWEKSGGGDIAIIFNGVPSDINTTPAQTVTLTAGSDVSPTENWVFVPESTGLLTASTVGFPEAKYAPVGRVLCQSAADIQVSGAYKVHAYSDHLYGSNNNGHASHLNAWVRRQPATWQSGVSVTPTGGASTLNLNTSSGVVLQLHEHTFPTFDTSTGSVMYVVNSNTANYNKISNLFDETDDSTGTSLSSWYTFVVWGVVNESDADCKLMINMPSGSYGNNSGGRAINDDEDYVDYSIPNDFRGTGFLIAAITVSRAGSTITIQNTADLRGLYPSTSAGGGGPLGGTEFADNVFRIQDEGDTTKQIAFEGSTITTGNTRTITVPDTDVDLGNIAINASDITTIEGEQTTQNAAIALNTAKVTDVAHPLVETAVPSGALFTDTIYDDTTIQAEVDLNTAKVSFDSTSSTRLANTSGTNTGDQILPTSGVDFDPVGTDNSDNNAVNTLYSGLQAAVDLNTAKVTNVDHPLVETAVPVGAVFTDTVYNDTAIQAEVDLNTTDRHTHLNKTTLDKFGENVGGLPTYNGLDVDTTIAQRDVYDGLDSLDNTISLSANNGKVLKDVQDTQQTAINLNTLKETNIVHPLVEEAVPSGALFTDTVYDDTAIQAEVDLNTAKVGITTTQANEIAANTLKVSYTDAAQVSTNSGNITTIQGEQTTQNGLISANTAKVGITTVQANEIAANTLKETNIVHPLVETAVPAGALFTDTVYDDTTIQAEVDLNTAKTGITAQQASDITANNAKVGVTTELKAEDIDTLAEVNAIITDATLIDTTDSRLSDARTPTAHTHVAADVTDFDTEVSNNTAVTANTAKVSFVDAPSDGSEYVRKDAAWAVATGGGGASALTTKGDIATYDTDDARLPVGTNGQQLVADSTEVTGLKWQDAPAVSPLPIVRLRSTAAQSANATTDIAIQWNSSEVKDTGFTHSTVTNNSRIEADVTGNYNLMGAVSYTGTTANYRFTAEVSIRINGATTLSSKFKGGYIRAANGANFNQVPFLLNLNLTAGDYVEILSKRISTTTGDATTEANTNISMTLLQGTTGATGATGEAGIPGTDGVDGSATVTIGTTSTGAAAVVNSGTPTAAVLDFTVPQGIQGETGPTGPAGADGTVTIDDLEDLPGFILRNISATQTIPPTAWTKVTVWDTEAVDDQNAASAGRVTPTVAGRYLVSSLATYVSITAGNKVIVALYKNGSIYALLGRGAVGGTDFAGFGGSAMVEVNGTTDYLEIYTYHNESGNATLSSGAGYNHFSGVLLKNAISAGPAGADGADSTVPGPTGPAGADGAAAVSVSEEETGTTYTLVLGDQNKYKRMNNASPITLTIPTNASVALPVDTEIEIEQTGAGVVTIAGAGVTINTFDGLLSNGQYWVMSLKKTATDTWTLIGGVS